MAAKKFLFFLSFVSAFSAAQAQEVSFTPAEVKPELEAEIQVLEQKEIPTQGILVEADSLFFELLENYVAEKKVMGYRIQLFSGNKRADADQVRANFMQQYDDERPDLIYQQPNFKIRVGNYRERFSASKQLLLYKIDFPSAFLVKAPIQAAD